MTAVVSPPAPDRYRSLLKACLAAQKLVDEDFKKLGFYAMNGWTLQPDDVLRAKADHIECRALAREYQAARPAIAGAAQG